MKYEITFKNGKKMTTDDGIEAFAAEFAEIHGIKQSERKHYCEICSAVAMEDETEWGTPYGKIFDFIADNWTFIKKHEDKLNWDDVALCCTTDGNIENLIEED